MRTKTKRKSKDYGTITKGVNIHVMKIAKKKKRTEEIFETVIAENFIKINVASQPQIQETQRTLNEKNDQKKRKMIKRIKKATSRHIIFIL